MRSLFIYHLIPTVETGEDSKPEINKIGSHLQFRGAFQVYLIGTRDRKQ